MSDSYAPPSTDDPGVAPVASPWVFRSQLTLGFCGVSYVLLGVGLPVLMTLPMMMDPSMPAEVAVLFGGIFGVVSLVMGVGIGLVNFAAAWGLGRRAKWAWFLTVALGGLYAPSICLPFGAVLLYGMLDDTVRKAYLEA